MKLIRKSEQITSSWPGGTTTQLFIYPENSSYQERNFLFRVSTATVEAEESVFTHLSGISRQIMILDGILKLEHTGRYTKILYKFETDSFKGDWETKGYGKVTDFNLMTADKVQGSLKAITLKKTEQAKFHLTKFEQFAGIYAWQGKLKVETENQIQYLNERDFLLATGNKNSSELTVKADEHSVLIISEIQLQSFRKSV